MNEEDRYATTEETMAIAEIVIARRAELLDRLS